MKKIILLSSFFISVQLSFGQGIEFFHGTWEEVLTHSQESGKLIFVDAYTKWCGPCKRMAKNVFTQAQVGDYYNERFINVKMNMESEDNTTFISTYPVRAYPTLFFIDGQGEVVLKSKGAKRADGLIELAKKASLANNKSDDYKIEYEAGKRNFDFMVKYIKELNAGDKPSLKIANNYIHSKPEITASQMTQFIYEAVSESDSRIFNLFVKKKTNIINKYGENAYKNKVLNACQKTINKAIEFESEVLKDDAINTCRVESKSNYKLFKLTSNKRYYKAVNDKENYYSAVNKYYKSIAKKDTKKLNSLINELLPSIKDKVAVNLMKKYFKQLIKIDPSVSNLVFGGQFFYKTKDKKTALTYIEQAKIKASGDKKKLQQIERLLNKYKS